MRRTHAYWITTGLFCAALAGSGVAHALRLPPIQEGMAHLGYPLYVTSILAAGKLLGVAALLAPGRPLLKEWAYAGFTFNLLGAAVSHALVPPRAQALAPLVLLALAVASYLLRPASRRLPAAPALAEALR